MLEFRDVTKHYGPTKALSGFTHRFAPGRVHALMGKNGSGKSTVVKLLGGVIQPTSGALFIKGKECQFTSPQDAFSAGIVTVHQELSLVPELSVGENIYLGRLPRRNVGGFSFVHWAALHAQADALLRTMGVKIKSRQAVSTLSVGQQQLVEIAKAMSFDPLILLLDEPTSALATQEVNMLFGLVRRLKERGVTIIYITHRMSELFDIAESCTVIRDGHYIGSVEMDDADHADIVGMMFGRAAHATRPPRRTIVRKTPVLQVKNISRTAAFRAISFDLFPGEILGLAGLLGAGRTEVMRAIFGADRIENGKIILNGQDVTGFTPQQMSQAGLGYTPENRKEVGLVQMAAIADNLCLASLNAIAKGGVMTRTQEKPFIMKQIKELSIKTDDPEQPVSSLSGGNQQKVVIGKWFNTQPQVILFDEPSRGVDVQAKRQIFDIIWDGAEQGVSSVFASTELEEVLEVADRVLVMRHGEIVKDVDPTQINLSALYSLCMEDPKN